MGEAERGVLLVCMGYRCFSAALGTCLARDILLHDLMTVTERERRERERLRCDLQSWIVDRRPGVF